MFENGRSFEINSGELNPDDSIPCRDVQQGRRRLGLQGSLNDARGNQTKSSGRQTDLVLTFANARISVQHGEYLQLERLRRDRCTGRKFPLLDVEQQIIHKRSYLQLTSACKIIFDER